MFNLQKYDPIRVEEVSQDNEVWSKVLNNAEYYTVDVSSSYITLCDIVMKQKYDSVQTFRMVFYIQKIAIAVWPIQIRQKEDDFEIGTNEGCVVPPVFCHHVSERIRKRIIDYCIDILLVICKEKNIPAWRSICPIRQFGVDLWQSKLLDSHAIRSRVEYVNHVLYTKLQTEEDPFSNYRKSFKSLVNVGKKRWNINLYNTITFEQMNRFRQFHIAVKGKETRDIATWKAQVDAINHKDAFLVTLCDEKNEIHGGGIFLLTPHESYYNSAAYDKELRKEPLGHIVQDAAIQYVRDSGVQWHRLGEKYFKYDLVLPSEKELQISHFKEGFSTHTFVDVTVKCVILK